MEKTVMHYGNSHKNKGLNLSDFLYVGALTGSVTVAGGTGQTATIDVTLDGYTAIGIVGFLVTGTASGNYSAVHTCRLTSATSAEVAVINTSGTQRTWTVTVYVLYVKE